MQTLADLRQGLLSARKKLVETGESLDLDKLRERSKTLEDETVKDGFWNDPDRASRILKEQKDVQRKLNEYQQLTSGLEEAEAMVELIEESEKEGLGPEDLRDEYQELEDGLAKATAGIDDLRMSTLLAGKYDSQDAILSIHAGAGGVEAMDWAEMLERMYLRYSEKHGYKTDIIDVQNDTVAGIKSATIVISGPNAYGYLKCEHGVHRLVRISPFNAAGKRQTSFAAVEVTPQLEGELEVAINPEDIRIDTYRSSGAGGQHVNTTDSAIRITHLPTNIVVTCQNERSQLRNKEVAMKILMSKLVKLAEEEHKENLNELKGDMNQVAWGSQIRSYVFQPYTMVKDHRTNAEVGNVEAVMDGYLDPFIRAKLIQDAKENA